MENTKITFDEYQKKENPYRAINEKYSKAYKDFLIGLLPTVLLEEGIEESLDTAKLPKEKWSMLCERIFCWFVQTPIELPIEQSKDLDEFAGKIVCYSAANYNRILFSETKWPKPKGYECMNFGYIPKEMTNWSTGETSYNMAILKGMNEVVCNCALTDDVIHEAGLTMRKATPEEIRIISEVCEAKKARFDYRDWPKLNDKYCPSC